MLCDWVLFLGLIDEIVVKLNYWDNYQINLILGDSVDFFKERLFFVLGYFVKSSQKYFFLSVGYDSGYTGHKVEIDFLFLVTKGSTYAKIVRGFLYFGIGRLGLKGHLGRKVEIPVLVFDPYWLVSDCCLSLLLLSVFTFAGLWTSLPHFLVVCLTALLLKFD